ncbi:hypothetical protein HU200_051671 [Digitaria exilis]|uniref:KIB1-4 beta-propeller domain-containing protein n=1 Tax=Digitaria exilis TaxID=1010633 RepID=A0A835E9H0_9POAL|nr:hypothetical protein HU200_051671 [Digitaria exilis]
MAASRSRTPPLPPATSPPLFQTCREAKPLLIKHDLGNEALALHDRRPCATPPPALDPIPISSSGSGARDWTNLGGDGPTDQIAELVLAGDVADYLRFRAVCRSWRRCTADPRGATTGLSTLFLPRQWIMLDKAHDASRRRRFLNVSTGECVRTDLPELAGHTLLAATPEGLLLLLHEPTLVVRLLNPLTRHLTELPPVTALLTEEERRDLRSGTTPLEDMLRVVGAGLADAETSTVAICFRWPTALAVARPGDERWTVVDGDSFIDSALTGAGRFYCASRSKIFVLDTDGTNQQPPRLRLVATEGSMPFYFFRISHSLHLVDNAGDLMLVHRMLGQGQGTGAQGVVKYSGNFKVFRVDLDAGALAPVKDLRGRAVVISLGRAVSVSVGAFPSISADTLYLGFDCAEKTIKGGIDGYNVAASSSEPSCYHGSCHDMVLAQPYSVVDCLSYCIRLNGEHLA